MRVSLFFSLSGPLLLLGACQTKNDPPEPTAPWRADAAIEEKPAAALLISHYQIGAPSSLHFRLPTKSTSPSGKLPVLSGQVEIPLHDLSKSRGRVTASLRHLQMDPWEEQDEEPARDPTELALNWLGLGKSVAPPPSPEELTASFELSALLQLSTTQAHRGQVLSTTDTTESVLKRVSAVAQGRVSVRRFSVEHRVPVQLDFEYAAAQPDTAPERIHVRFPRGFRVPLNEHGIEPRDEAGRALPQKRALLGTAVGHFIEISGELVLLPLHPSQPE